MEKLLFKNICSDSYSLNQYLKDKNIDIEDIKRNLFILERSKDFSKPDHLYKMKRDAVFNKINTIRSLIINIFSQICEELIMYKGSQIHIKNGCYQTWQNQITETPPLSIISFALYKKNTFIDDKNNVISQSLLSQIRLNTETSVLPSPDYSQMDHLIAKEGLCDTHIHLNGTTEFDSVWINALKNPKIMYKELQEAYKDEKVKEFFEQIELDLTPQKIYKRLVIASNLRAYLCKNIFISKQESITLKNLEHDEQRFSFEHPVKQFLKTPYQLPDIIYESVFLIKMFKYINCEASEKIAKNFHLYLLIYGFFNKFLTQQKNQSGFDQFQKISDNETRSEIEKNYDARFKQLFGNKTQEEIQTIEGRFSPKDTVEKNLRLLNKIFSGFYNYHGDTFNMYGNNNEATRTRNDLKLIAHFIKKKDSKNNNQDSIKVRHHKLRKELEKKAKTLISTRNISPFLKKYIVGIDAAANELDAPPEVFAPCYRYCRQKGITNFTYHVGEDFIHLLSGLRAIFEAIIFFDLKNGNRIGHATALGICPTTWLNKTPSKITISKGEMLDNLIFAYYILSESEKANLFSLENLKLKIEELYFQIYHPDTSLFSIYTLIEAWKHRFLDPFIICYPYEKQDKIYLEERKEWNLVDNFQKKYPDSFNLFKQYHSPKYRKNYNERIPFSLNEPFKEKTTDIFEEIQNSIAKIIHEKEIAVESMLTSNLRISVYDSYEDHHLWRWLGLTEDKYFTNIPVTIGSDDPGIFSTNIKNEYIQIYEQLIFSHKLSHKEAADIIKGLINNGQIYVFS